MKWQDKISKAQLKHLREIGITTLTQAKKNADFQKDNVDFKCSECRLINHKLGLA